MYETYSNQVTNNTLLPAPVTFGSIDYIVFFLFLGVSAGVGIFFSVRGHKNTSDYFFGGGEMHPIPVGISNGVSFLSAVVLVGYPDEIYQHGSDSLLDLFTGSLSYFSCGALVALVLRPLKFNSMGQYFFARFGSKWLNLTADVMVIICIFEYMGSCMLGSVVAFNSVSGGQVSIILALIIADMVGIFYTAIGGIKAVIWTDVIQCGFMMTGIFLVVVHSMSSVPGGLSNIIYLNKRYERIHPLNWSADMTVRHTVWGNIIGKFIYYGLWPIQPAGVQRICSTKTLKGAFIVCGMAGILFFFFAGFPMWAGFNIFGYYAYRGCDIQAAGWVKENQVLLYYVRDKLNNPGFQGFFLAALFSGSLSSFSSGLSAASSIIMTDILGTFFPNELSERKSIILSKVLVVCLGICSMFWCYALHSFGKLIIQMILSIDSSMYGSYFGLFIFASCFRYANYIGGLVGMVVSFIITLWLGLGNVLFGNSKTKTLPTTVANCIYLNISNGKNNTDRHLGAFYDTIYSLSYVWLPPICLLIYLTVAVSVTFCTRKIFKVKYAPEHLLAIFRPGYFNSTKCTGVFKEKVKG